MATPDPDEGRSLHDVAVDAQTDLQKLATGLAHAGASPQAVQQLTAMAGVLAGVVKVLGQSPEVEHAAQQGPPPGAQAPGQAAPAGPPQEPMHAPTLQAATQHLHAMAQQAAQQRAQQGR